LREPTDDNSRRGDSGVDFGFYEVVEVALGPENASGVFGTFHVSELSLGNLVSISRVKTKGGLFTISYQPGICIPKFCKFFREVSSQKGRGKKGELTIVMGICGALGNINLTSGNFSRRRQFSAREIQPPPLSPRPWAIMTVAVCFVTAGIVRADIFAIGCSV